jgi:hypothetical protein
MPTKQGDHRLTINLPVGLWQQLEELAEALHLKIGSCARMLLAEALATRDLYPKVPPPRPARRARPSRRTKRHNVTKHDKT